MGKGSATASVVFVVGPSTAGKSTICREILAQNQNLPSSQRLDWQVSGYDAMQEIILAKRDEKLLSELESDPRFQAIQKLNLKFNEVKPRKPFEPFAAEKLYEAIYGGCLEYKGQKLDLLDAKKFDAQLAEFLAKTDREFFSEEILRTLQPLAQEKHDAVKAICNSVGDRFEERLFDHAIASSKAGKPIVLDVIPDAMDGKSLVERFEEYCAKQNHHCPTYVALVHLSVKELTARMEARNAAAIARDEPADQRKNIFPFRSLSEVAAPSKQITGEIIIGTVTRKDLDHAILKFSELNRTDLTPERREFLEKKEVELYTKFGFGDTAKAGEETQPIELIAIPPFDQVYDLTSKESTALVAKKICALATDKSQTPTEESKAASAIKNDPKFGEIFREKIAQEAETESGVRSEIFVERLGLKHVETMEKVKLPSHVDILREKYEQKIHEAADPKNQGGGR